MLTTLHLLRLYALLDCLYQPHISVLYAFSTHNPCQNLEILFVTFARKTRVPGTPASVPPPEPVNVSYACLESIYLRATHTKVMNSLRNPIEA